MSEHNGEDGFAVFGLTLPWHSCSSIQHVNHLSGQDATLNITTKKDNPVKMVLQAEKEVLLSWTLLCFGVIIAVRIF